ncbi:hypothetical protein [Streptomyces sp. NBC_00083]|uniref:hypothetical protein n=1 Tax=Streptomyces sp. NBC_00083 TaxID=2975647 RepID=UPI002254C87B|nr:hypothetical protein [Streptomyces sp. NBC_00083]MCX5386844.1 hypothetical protein [Streptomyces sp. NBC_00083]
MKTTRLAGLGLAAVLSCAGALLFGVGTPASADTADLTFSTDTTEVTPGSTVDLTVTLTNSQATEVRFVYQSIRPTWETSRQPALTYTQVSCRSEGDPCKDDGSGRADGSGNLGLSYALPLAPGESRSVTLTYRIAPDSACGRELGFSSYLYYEYGGGLFSASDTYWSPVFRVVCPAARS